jgi:thioredoxin reductase
MVVGGGSAAVEEALFLSKHASKVILILLYVEFLASPDCFTMWLPIA